MDARSKRLDLDPRAQSALNRQADAGGSVASKPAASSSRSSDREESVYPRAAASRVATEPARAIAVDEAERDAGREGVRGQLDGHVFAAREPEDAGVIEIARVGAEDGAIGQRERLRARCAAGVRGSNVRVAGTRGVLACYAIVRRLTVIELSAASTIWTGRNIAGRENTEVVETRCANCATSGCDLFARLRAENSSRVEPNGLKRQRTIRGTVCPVEERGTAGLPGVELCGRASHAGRAFAGFADENNLRATANPCGRRKD